MDTQQHREYRKYVAVLEFATTTTLPTPLEATPAFTAQVTALQTAMTALRQADQEYVTAVLAGRQYRTERDALHEALRTQLRRVQRIARVIGRQIPGVRDAVRIPSAPRREEALLSSARAVIEQVRPMADAFVARGLAPDCLDRIAQLIAAIDATATARATSRRRRVTARETITTALQQSRDAVHCLDVIVRTQCDPDTESHRATLEAWTRASEVLGTPHPKLHSKPPALTPAPQGKPESEPEGGVALPMAA